MAAGVFTITELLQVGGVSQDAEIGEIFEWSSDRTPADPVRGGARACPQRPWTFGKVQRRRRTEYTGSRTPSEQIFGSNFKPFSLTGKFDDRYNFDGYAVREMRRLEDLVDRGNLARFQFQNQVFHGLPYDLEFDYVREWYIVYRFTVSNHGRPESLSLADRSPPNARSPQEAFEEVDQVTAALIDSQGGIPEGALAGTLAGTSGANVAGLAANRDSIGGTLDAREFGVAGRETVNPFRRLATQFRDVQLSAFNVTQDLIAARADTELGVKDALSVLNFEDWSRTQRFYARVLMGMGGQSAAELEEREDPNAIALYRPFAGESLYQVSNRFYNTPQAWHLIASRNSLKSIKLSGDELLIIPARGQA